MNQINWWMRQLFGWRLIWNATELYPKGSRWEKDYEGLFGGNWLTGSEMWNPNLNRIIINNGGPKKPVDGPWEDCMLQAKINEFVLEDLTERAQIAWLILLRIDPYSLSDCPTITGNAALRWSTGCEGHWQSMGIKRHIERRVEFLWGQLNGAWWVIFVSSPRTAKPGESYQSFENRS